MKAPNPFATRFTRPGLLAPVDAAARPIDVERVCRRLEVGGHAAIVGPHGSGKSTLLAHCFASLRRRGIDARLLRVRSWRDVPRLAGMLVDARPGLVLCIDSWECLGSVPGRMLRALAAFRRCQLLVTSHRAAGFPVFVECHPTPAVLESLLRHLPGYAGWYGEMIRADDVRDAFARHRGDIREALFDLYDRFEARRRRPVPVRI